MGKSTVYSCYVFSPSGRVLLTRRALRVTPWPGTWMGSWWGTSEDPEQALAAAVRAGLGVTLTGVRVLRSDLRCATGVSDQTATGPVFAGVTRDLPSPDPRVVMDWRWADWRRLVDLATVASWTLCPWTADQIPELDQWLSADPIRVAG